MANLGNKIALGAIWMVLMRLSIRFIGLISTLILLRLLSPRDFGLVALVMAVVATIDLIRSFGFEIALIQDQDAGRDEYDTVWTMEVLMATGTGLIMALIAQPAAQYYEEPRLAVLFLIIGAANFVHGFANVGIVDFRKELMFAKEFRYNVAVKVVGFVTTISCAFIMRSYWALIVGTVVTKLAMLVLSYTMHAYRPRFSLKALGKLFRFSKWIFFNNMGIVARMRGPDFMIGKFSGTAGLGIYTVAYEISNLATTELIAPINRALLPGFAKIAHDPPRARAAFVKAAAVMTLFSMPVAFGIAATAPLIGEVILGTKWLAAVPLMQLLALAGVVTAIASPITSALIAMGKPHVVAWLSLANAIVLLNLVWKFGWESGALGAAQAVLLTALVFLPVYFAISMKYLYVSVRDILTIVLRPLMGAVLMYWLVTKLLRLTGISALDLVLAAGIGAVIYMSCVLLLWRIMPTASVSAEAFLLERIRERLAARGLIRPSADSALP